MKNKYGFCKGLAALVLLMLCALTIKDNAYAQTAKSYKVLFIGNSHTYYNDMPNIFKGIAKADGIDCECHQLLLQDTNLVSLQTQQTHMEHWYTKLLQRIHGIMLLYRRTVLF